MVSDDRQTFLWRLARALGLPKGVEPTENGLLDRARALVTAVQITTGALERVEEKPAEFQSTIDVLTTERDDAVADRNRLTDIEEAARALLVSRGLLPEEDEDPDPETTPTEEESEEEESYEEPTPEEIALIEALAVPGSWP